MIAFLDPTALAAFYIATPDHPAAREAVEQAEGVAIATLTQVHFMAMLDALMTDGVPQDVTLAIGQRFLEDGPRFMKVHVEIRAAVLWRAGVRHDSCGG